MPPDGSQHWGSLNFETLKINLSVCKSHLERWYIKPKPGRSKERKQKLILIYRGKDITAQNEEDTLPFTVKEKWGRIWVENQRVDCRASSRFWDDFPHSTSLLLPHTPDWTWLDFSGRQHHFSKSYFAGMRTKLGGTASEGLLDMEVWPSPAPGGLGLEEARYPGPRLSCMEYRTCTDSKNVNFFSFNVWKIIHLWWERTGSCTFHLYILSNWQDRTWKDEQFKFHCSGQHNQWSQTVWSERLC